MKIIKEKKKGFPYDKHMLDGIDYVDMKTAIVFMKSAISGDVHDKTSPYSAVRKLILYFDPSDGILRHGKAGARDVVEFVERNAKLRKAKNFLRFTDNELIELLYEQKMYRGYELLEKVTWKLQDVRKHLEDFLNEIDATNMFSGMLHFEPVVGSADGKRLGLKDLCKRAKKSIYELSEFISKLEKIATKGRDPLTYR